MSQAKLTLIPRENRAIAIAPDLAIKVVSDSEPQQETERRLRDYLGADVEMWQVFPSFETITVWRGRQGLMMQGDDLLTSELLPVFSVAVREIFA